MNLSLEIYIFQEQISTNSACLEWLNYEPLSKALLIGCRGARGEAVAGRACWRSRGGAAGHLGAYAGARTTTGGSHTPHAYVRVS